MRHAYGERKTEGSEMKKPVIEKTPVHPSSLSAFENHVVEKRQRHAAFDPVPARDPVKHPVRPHYLEARSFERVPELSVCILPHMLRIRVVGLLLAVRETPFPQNAQEDPVRPPPVRRRNDHYAVRPQNPFHLLKKRLWLRQVLYDVKRKEHVKGAVLIGQAVLDDVGRKERDPALCRWREPVLEIAPVYISGPVVKDKGPCAVAAAYVKEVPLIAVPLRYLGERRHDRVHVC